MRRSGVMSLLSVAGAFSIVVAIGTGIGLGIVPLVRARASLGWNETRCHIEHSEVETSRNSHRARVEYSYDAGGSSFTSTRVDFAIAGWSNYAWSAAAEVRRYSTGSEVPCWYDPDDPASAVLSRTAPATLFLLFPLVFGVAGFGLLRHGARRSDDEAPGAPGSDGRFVHVRRCSTAGVVIACAALWSIATTAALLATSSGDRIAEVAFIACAAITTLALVYELRCLLSVVQVSAPVQLRHGEHGRAEWSARSLLCSPRATASLIAVATTSETVTRRLAVSYEVTVETVSTTPLDEDAGQPGAGTLRLPADAPASTPERRIDWFVEIHVHLPFGPDVTSRVPITVVSAGAP